jgi:hypothetical protein
MSQSSLSAAAILPTSAPAACSSHGPPTAVGLVPKRQWLGDTCPTRDFGHHHTPDHRDNDRRPNCSLTKITIERMDSTEKGEREICGL